MADKFHYHLNQGRHTSNGDCKTIYNIERKTTVHRLNHLMLCNCSITRLKGTPQSHIEEMVENLHFRVSRVAVGLESKYD